MSAEKAAAAVALAFALTEEDVRLASSRVALRLALAGRLSRDHAAPLVAFALVLLFIAVLAFSGLVGRRFAEIALLLATAAFMAIRTRGHARLRGARKRSLAALEAMRNAGSTRVRLDEWDLRLESASEVRCLRFADCDEAETVDAILYLWPRNGMPAIIPARAFADDGAACAFLDGLRAAIRRASRSS